MDINNKKDMSNPVFAIKYSVTGNPDDGLYGSFNEVPKGDVFLADIIFRFKECTDGLNSPEFRQFHHRIILGDEMPAEAYMSLYGKNLPMSELQEIASMYEENKDLKLIIPKGEVNERYCVLDRNDTLCNTLEEFSKTLADFKTSKMGKADFLETPLEELTYSKKYDPKSYDWNKLYEESQHIGR